MFGYRDGSAENGSNIGTGEGTIRLFNKGVEIDWNSVDACVGRERIGIDVYKVIPSESLRRTGHNMTGGLSRTGMYVGGRTKTKE